MNVVMLIQSGESGPVKIQGAAGKNVDQAIRRTVNALQRGNPDELHIRLVLDGDERLEARMAQEWAEWERARGWYDVPGNVLVHTPLEIPRWPYGEQEERQRFALLELESL